MSVVTRRGFLAASAGSLLTLAACGGAQQTAPEAPASMEASAPASHYTYRFASAEEGAQLIVGNDEYLQGFNQCDLDYRMQKTGATLEEWKTLAAGEVRDFTEEEQQGISACMDELEQIIAKRGLVLPASDEIVFVKTTMQEEGGAAAYTHGTQIYLHEQVIARQLLATDEKLHMSGIELLSHELFHCLTRSNPDFRAQMYQIIGFEVQDDDFAFGPDVAKRLLSNPDVEHHNSSALFTIGGQELRCTAVFYATKFFDTAGETFFDNSSTGLVPVDDLNTLYDCKEAENFWEVFGKNTDYVIDPEETMADNFSFAVTYGLDGKEYPTPKIIEAILTQLSA